jgi:hypothetical protein
MRWATVTTSTWGSLERGANTCPPHLPAYSRPSPAARSAPTQPGYLYRKTASLAQKSYPRSSLPRDVLPGRAGNDTLGSVFGVRTRGGNSRRLDG